MRFTTYFLHVRSRPDRAAIEDDWIERAIRAPERRQRQAEGRIRRWVYIPEVARDLRVVLLADEPTGHKAFFDLVFDDTGRAIARVDLPPAVEPFRVSRDRIVGTWTDADDVPHVMIWRVQPTP